jgi:hypothetical protein
MVVQALTDNQSRKAYKKIIYQTQPLVRQKADFVALW